MSPMIKQPLTLEHALLGFLRAASMHAYQMHQQLLQAEALGLVWRLKQSQLYALLARLEQAGYIDATTESQENRPARRLLHLTSDGQAVFTEWLTEPVSHGRDFRQEFLAKLFFAHQEGAASARHLIIQQRRVCQEWQRDLRVQIEGTLEPHTYAWLVLQFRLGNVDAILAWLDTCERTFTLP